MSNRGYPQATQAIDIAKVTAQYLSSMRDTRESPYYTPWNHKLLEKLSMRWAAKNGDQYFTAVCPQYSLHQDYDVEDDEFVEDEDDEFVEDDDDDDDEFMQLDSSPSLLALKRKQARIPAPGRISAPVFYSPTRLVNQPLVLSSDDPLTLSSTHTPAGPVRVAPQSSVLVQPTSSDDEINAFGAKSAAASKGPRTRSTRIPDFVIGVYMCKKSNNEVLRLGTAAIVEIKGSRSYALRVKGGQRVHGRTALEQSAQNMFHQVVEQAEHAFASDENSRPVKLGIIRAIGGAWTYGEISKDAFSPRSASQQRDRDYIGSSSPDAARITIATSFLKEAMKDSYTDQFDLHDDLSDSALDHVRGRIEEIWGGKELEVVNNEDENLEDSDIELEDDAL